MRGAMSKTNQLGQHEGNMQSASTGAYFFWRGFYFVT